MFKITKPDPPKMFNVFEILTCNLDLMKWG